MTQSRQSLIVGLVVFVVMAVALVERTVTAPGFALPPRWYDAQDYENIGYHLAAGRGFGLAWNSPAFLAPYRDERIRDGYKWIDFQRGWRPRDGGFARTTGRPPALPFVISLTYEVVGRHFGAVRVVSALFLALAIGVASALAAELAGAGAGVVTALLAGFSPHTLGFARLSMTEPMSAALVVLAAAAGWAFVKTGRLRFCALAGATMGLAILARSALVLSVPVVALALYALARWWRPPVSPRPGAAAACFLAAALLVPSPWWVRNCATLDAFMPLGVQGGIGLAGAYGDEPYRRTLAGQPWSHPNRWNFFEPLLRDPAYRALRSELQERERARYGQSHALAWMADHPGKLPVLAAKRIQLHWLPRDERDVLVRLLALAGLCVFARRPETWWAAAFVLANSLTVAATFAVKDGRFLAPVEPLLFAFAGAALWHGVRALFRRFAPGREGPRARSP